MDRIQLVANSSTQMGFSALSPYQRLLVEFRFAFVLLLIPLALLYLAIYSIVGGRHFSHALFTFLSITGFLACSWIAPVQCGPFRSLQLFAVAIGILKALDLFARRHRPFRYASPPVPPRWVVSLKLLTELRYESFEPNHIRISKDFSEPLQLVIHAGAFAILQSLPQNYNVVLALEVLLAVYILWTTLGLVLRYQSSPALFGPLYKARSIAGFWSETWHKAFTSPVSSLGYYPTRTFLVCIGAPVHVAKSAGVVAAFTLMGAFHVLPLQPLLPRMSLARIGLFFVINGIATVCEVAIWGDRKSWWRTAIAWLFEVTLATWTVETAYIPRGLNKIPWRDMCNP